MNIKKIFEMFPNKEVKVWNADDIGADKAVLGLKGSPLGRDLGPRVSARLSTGLTADRTSLDIDTETNNLLMTRPAFGGNLMATIVCGDHRSQLQLLDQEFLKD